MEEAGELLKGLDEHQRRAVTATEHPLAIIAPAGSGKTTVLTRRIAHRVAIETADPDHTVALTFTRQAANELRDRLGRLGVRGAGLRVGTFHAVAHGLLRQRWADRSKRAPTLVTAKLRLLAEVAGKGGHEELAAIATEIDWARATLTPPERYGPTARAHGRRVGVDSDRIAAVMADYATLKRRRGVIDFDDLLAECTTELRRDPQYSAAVQWRFRHLFVDEFQDLNPLQHALLEAWRSGRPDICVVGDPRQAIYAWNGSDPRLLDEVDRTLPGVTVVRLRANYRSTPQVVAAAAAVLPGPDDTVAVRADGPEVTWLAVGDDDEEATLIARLARDAHQPGERWASIGILARTNAQLTPIAAALDRLRVPSVIPTASQRPVLDAVTANLLNDAKRIPGVAELLAWAFDLTDGLDSTAAGPIHEAVAAAVRRFAAEMAGTDGAAFAEWYALGAANAVEDAVALLTFHAAKGREWRTVIIAGFEADLVPHYSARNAEARAEERRLAHVALSRATERLIITRTDTRAGRTSGPSPFMPTPPASVDARVDDSPWPRPQMTATDPGSTAAMASLVEWRRRAARAANMQPEAVVDDATMRRLATELPADLDAVVSAAGLGPSTARHLGPRLTAAVAEAGRAAAAARADAAARPDEAERQATSTITGA